MNLNLIQGFSVTLGRQHQMTKIIYLFYRIHHLLAKSTLPDMQVTQLVISHCINNAWNVLPI